MIFFCFHCKELQVEKIAILNIISIETRCITNADELRQVSGEDRRVVHSSAKPSEGVRATRTPRRPAHHSYELSFVRTAATSPTFPQTRFPSHEGLITPYRNLFISFIRIFVLLF